MSWSTTWPSSAAARRACRPRSASSNCGPSSRSAFSRKARRSARIRCRARCMEPGPLDALLPAWRNAPLPIRVPVTRDEFRVLGAKGSRRVPWLPRTLHNEGNFIISLGGLNQWLASQAEAARGRRVRGFRRRAAAVRRRRLGRPACRSATWACSTTAAAALTTRPGPKCTRGSPSSPKAAAAASPSC